MADRLKQLICGFPDEIDAVLITSDLNRRYYLGFPSSAGVLVVTKDQPYFIVDSRYYEAAQHAVKNCRVVLRDKLYEQISGLIEKHGIKTLAVESDAMSLSEYARFKEGLPDAVILSDDRLSRLIAKQRSVKSAREMESVAAAQEITDKTFSRILNFIRPGLTELQIAVEMEFYARSIGSEGPAFSYIVAAGKHSSQPHAVPTEQKIKRGDLIVLDFGATVEGYCSDMTRTVAVGTADSRQREVYGIVLRAQLAALAAIKVGVSCREIDKIARDIIDASAYAGLFGHGLGHSLGLEIHEEPHFGTACEEILMPGMVLSVEPGIYIPGEFGVRIEDIMAVTENGCRNFTHSPKELLVI